MKINVKKIPSRGLDLKETVPPSAIGLEPGDIDLLSPLDIHSKVELVQNTVLVHTQVKAKFSFTCARCLEAVEEERIEEFDFDYQIDKTTESIDLGEDIRQEMIIERPVKILCKEDCKGLCSKCGVSLNIETCKCKE